MYTFKQNSVVIFVLLAIAIILISISVTYKNSLNELLPYNQNETVNPSIVILKQVTFDRFVNPTDTISVTLEIINDGDADITDIVVKETLPKGFVLVDDQWELTDDKNLTTPQYTRKIKKIMAQDRINLMYSIYVSSTVEEGQLHTLTYLEGVADDQNISSNVIDSQIEVKVGELLPSVNTQR